MFFVIFKVRIMNLKLRFKRNYKREADKKTFPTANFRNFITLYNIYVCVSGYTYMYARIHTHMQTHTHTHTHIYIYIYIYIYIQRKRGRRIWEREWKWACVRERLKETDRQKVKSCFFLLFVFICSKILAGLVCRNSECCLRWKRRPPKYIYGK